jgi:hypothetical protein
VFEGEEGFKLVLYIGLFNTGEKLAKEECLNLFETRRGLSVVCMTRSLNYHSFS